MLPVLFFSHDTPTTEIYTLSLHDALPIHGAYDLANVLHPPTSPAVDFPNAVDPRGVLTFGLAGIALIDRKSTRLNSSHEWISYAVFCLKKKNIKIDQDLYRHTEQQHQQLC